MFLLKEVEELLGKFIDKVYTPNVLDGKTKELIAISNAVMVDCIPCIDYHYKKAKEYGASKEEIAETLAIALAVSAGNKKAKYSKLIEDLSSTNI